MREGCADFGCHLVEFNGEPEHVLLLVNSPPTVAISRLVSSLKGYRPAGCGNRSLICAATTGGPNGCGLGPTSPGLFGAAPTSACASTLSSRTRRPS
jgi:hypothetical protein